MPAIHSARTGLVRAQARNHRFGQLARSGLQKGLSTRVSIVDPADRASSDTLNDVLLEARMKNQSEARLGPILT